LKAVVLERNRVVSRKIARIWGCAGLDVTVVDDPAAVDAAAADATLLGADAFDGDLVVALLRRHPRLRAVLWTAEPIDRTLRFIVEEPRLSNVFGRPSFDDTPREWELLLVGRRLHRHEPVPFGAFLSWGFHGFKDEVSDSAGRDQAVAHAQRFAERLGAPRRLAEMFGELAHELLMNALYDAPVDANGRPRHAHDRKAPVALRPDEAASLRVASDGVRLCIQVSDPFGRLQRKHVFHGLARGLSGQLDRSGGGAGLGIVTCLQSAGALVFDVAPGARTEVTGVLDLDLNLRELKTQAKSLHFFNGTPA
jgi:hypothetical protein